VPQYEWRGHSVDIRVVAIPKDLTALVTVDGQRLTNTYRQAGREPWVAAFEFEDAGITHTGRVQFERLWDSLSVRYELFVDDSPVAGGQLKAEFRVAPLLALAGIPIFFALFVLGVAALAR